MKRLTAILDRDGEQGTKSCGRSQTEAGGGCDAEASDGSTRSSCQHQQGGKDLVGVGSWVSEREGQMAGSFGQ